MTGGLKTAPSHPQLENAGLGDVAVACLMFNSLTSYNWSLARLSRATGKPLNLAKPEHREALLTWLNEWGCRHLAKDQHGVSSEGILNWYKGRGERHARATTPLWLLDDGELMQAAEAYGALKDLPGANRVRGGNEVVVTIGPTAASKVLFALRPEAFAPWDDAMRKHFGCDGSAESYCRFLVIVRDLALRIGGQCERNDFPIARLPEELDRPGSTMVALLNEYLWVTVSAGVRLPGRETLARWAAWKA